MSGWLPPGTTDADIDRAALGNDEPPFYCSVYERTGMHCADFNHPQCGMCERTEHNPVTTAIASGRAPTMEEVADVVGKGERS